MLDIVKTSIELAKRLISAAIFGLLLLLAFALTSGMGKTAYFGLYRYDYLLFYAIIIQIILLYIKWEHWAEAKVIGLFHVLAMGMELFMTHPAIGSWQYPQPALFKVATVPLFAGFMYSAVGSFLARSLRLFSVKIEDLPPLSWMMGLAIVAYINFMSKYFIADLRYFLFAASIALLYRTRVSFEVAQQRKRLPMLVVLVLLAFAIWIAENISTFYHIWLYPTQVERWHMVGWGKLGSWYLLLLLSLTLVMQIIGYSEPTKTWRIHWQLKPIFQAPSSKE